MEKKFNLTAKEANAIAAVIDYIRTQEEDTGEDLFSEIGFASLGVPLESPRDFMMELCYRFLSKP